MRVLKQSHSAEKLDREDPLGLLKLQFAAEYQKVQGDPLTAKKLSKKNNGGGKFNKYNVQCDIIYSDSIVIWVT